MLGKFFQSIVNQIGSSLDKTFGVIDESLTVIACNRNDKIGETAKSFNHNSLLNSNVYITDEHTYKSFGTHIYPGYVVFVSGNDNISKDYANLISVTMENALKYHNERYDKSNFIKNILLDNVLSGDIYIKSRKLKFNLDVNRVCMIIKTTSKSDTSACEVVKGLFPDKNKDFVININENNIVLVKEIPKETDTSDFEKLAISISDTLSGEYSINSVIGIGTPVNGIKDLARSFKESQVAVEVGKVFDTNKNIISYANLGIARLVYQLPTTLCEAFLKEIFKRGSIESMDQETLFTIQKFFENSLNISETSRKLFVHRNTLVYRLEKIKKITGLDLREFEDAIVFKIALMVKKYLVSNPTKY
ncbi:MAG: helix-turn-helix domain-containing protein [Oscillospiraceae bacterium]|jgi:carbohydrate diacid regulator|nr:helix-turn-helix domain-containing protein [Oscillospiraceae bacterium]